MGTIGNAPAQRKGTKLFRKNTKKNIFSKKFFFQKVLEFALVSSDIVTLENFEIFSSCHPETMPQDRMSVDDILKNSVKNVRIHAYLP